MFTCELGSLLRLSPSKENDWLAVNQFTVIENPPSAKLGLLVLRRQWIRSARIHIAVAISKYLQNAFASLMCRGVLHCTWNKAGLATITATHCAREIATFNRFKLYKNSMPLGASSGVDVVIE